MLKNEKILITGPASQVALPIALNQVYGLTRFSIAADRTQVEGLGVKCIPADLAKDSFANVGTPSFESGGVREPGIGKRPASSPPREPAVPKFARGGEFAPYGAIRRNTGC
jgi:hypothetical protein